MTGVATPPNDDDKYAYIDGPQHRWFFWFHALAFVGVAISLLGFATRTYWTLPFLIPLAVYGVELALGLGTSTLRRRVTKPDHQMAVELWSPTRYPAVDVFLPTAGEDLHLLANTYRHVHALEWPGKLSIHVLDDTDREEVRQLAESFGFDFLARPGSAFKKAGNLQYAFQRTTGEHILILDADFVPRSDLLTELIPYMDDPTVGIVQSPQVFRTSRDMGWLERTAGATQEAFYRFIQPSRDAVGAAICVGTSAVYRRAALRAIGGFPQIAHSEDVFTGIAMGREGYGVQYVPINVSRGICPGDLDSFVAQQYRWCEGSMQLAASKDFHADTRMGLLQRLSYWSGFSYYLSTAINAFFAPLPALLMIWLFPADIFAINMLPLVGVVLLWLVVYPLACRGRWRLEVLRVQTIYSFAHAVAIYDVFFGETAEWVPSHGARASTPLASKVRAIMGWYLGLTQIALFVGVLLRLCQGQYDVSNWWATLLFVAINAYVFCPVVWLALTTSMRRDSAPDVDVRPAVADLEAVPA